ncbi:MAG TPA: tRNA (adenosine(37)-N6)-dimethylallyltransferase MiaA [Candidatus Paceibacterota bacterium]
MKKSPKKSAKEKPKIIVVLGPNASGKSALGVKLAQKFNGEIISADSRQVYRGLDIGTGKITKAEMGGIRHHLLDIASPRRVFTVVQYQKRAKRATREILKRGRLPIVVGGTGLYIDALIHNLTFPSVPPQPRIRQKLERLSTEKLFDRLRVLDPERAILIDPHNRRRLIRAMEIAEVAGKTIPRLKRNSPYKMLKIGLGLPENVLKKRIADRLKQRLKEGLIEEVEKLHRQGISWKRLEGLGLEYRYVARYLRDLLGREEMIQKLEIEIRRYAKRQMTWFRRDKEIIWLSDPRKAFPIVQDLLGR